MGEGVGACIFRKKNQATFHVKCLPSRGSHEMPKDIYSEKKKQTVACFNFS